MSRAVADSKSVCVLLFLLIVMHMGKVADRAMQVHS